MADASELASAPDAVADVEDLPRALCPRVPFYGPSNVRNLEPGTVRLWCTCGLSERQPWCDGSHRGTEFKPLKWTVPGADPGGKAAQSLYQLCSCKYTCTPPLCDATHMSLPLKHIRTMHACTRDHAAVTKICGACGWTPGTVLPTRSDPSST